MFGKGVYFAGMSQIVASILSVHLSQDLLCDEPIRKQGRKRATQSHEFTIGFGLASDSLKKATQLQKTMQSTLGKFARLPRCVVIHSVIVHSRNFRKTEH